jgi:hypothetical protein
MSLERLESVITEFGKIVGLPELELNQDGYCPLIFDDIVVNFKYDGETDELLMWSSIGEIPPEPVRKDIYEMLLEANIIQSYLGGGVLTIEKNHNIILLINSTPTELIDLKTFEDTLDNFIKLTETWEKVLEEAIQDGHRGEEDTPTEPVTRV